MGENGERTHTRAGAVGAGGQRQSRTRNSPAATPIAAIAAAYIPSASTHPTTNPARGPNASRAYTYLPPARGSRVASSANSNAPRKASAPPAVQATKVSQGRPNGAAPTTAPPPPPPPPHPPAPALTG